MPPDVTPREQEEYRALRATIGTRGTARVWVFMVGLVAWAGLLSATSALALPPIAALSSLLVLAAAFEAVFALHVSVERIGRYLQVFHEDRWEQTAMDFGFPLAGTGGDPLFAAFFGFATFLNLLPVIGGDAVQIELVVIGAAHVLFLGRVILARRIASRQRRADLERFRALQRGT